MGRKALARLSQGSRKALAGLSQGSPPSPARNAEQRHRDAPQGGGGNMDALIAARSRLAISVVRSCAVFALLRESGVIPLLLPAAG